MLPFSIPGMVWDPIRKKYFPAGSQGAGGGPAGSSRIPGLRRVDDRRSGLTASRLAKRPMAGDANRDGRTKKRRNPIFAGEQASQLLAWQRSLAGPLGGVRDRVGLAQAALAGARVVETVYMPLPARNAFVTAVAGNSTHIVAGDSTGSLHVLDLTDRDGGWQTTLSIAASGPISAISAQDDNILATSFGPSPVLIHSPIDMQGGGCTISRPEKATDVTSSLLLPGGGIVLGCSSHMMIGKAPLLNSFRKVSLKPRSSVLALCSVDREIDPAGNVVLSGLRSGAVGQYDLRTPWLDVSRQPAVQVATAVVGLQSTGGWHIAVAGMNGSIEIHDLRFATPAIGSESTSKPAQASRPVLQLTGHCNSHTTGLAFRYLPRARMLLAAGEDNLVRLWDCRDGALRSTGGGRLAGAGDPFGSMVTGVVDLAGLPPFGRSSGREAAQIGIVSGQQWDLLGS